MTQQKPVFARLSSLTNRFFKNHPKRSQRLPNNPFTSPKSSRMYKNKNAVRETRFSESAFITGKLEPGSSTRARAHTHTHTHADAHRLGRTAWWRTARAPESDRCGLVHVLATCATLGKLLTTSLSLGFLVCKRRMIIVPTS